MVKKLLTLVLLSLVVFFYGCGGKGSKTPITESGSGMVNFELKGLPGGTGIAKVTVTITGIGITTPIVRDLTISVDGTKATGSVSVPVGMGRTILVEAKDAGGQVLFKGSTTIDIVAGVNTLKMTLDTVTGEINIEITIPSYYTPPAYTQDNLTDTEKAQVKTHIDTARSKLFKAEVTATDFNEAKTAVSSALTISPNSPDANLLSAIIDIGDEAERIKKDVVALIDAGSIFPLGGFKATEKIVFKALQPVIDSTLSGISSPEKVKSKSAPRHKKGKWSEEPLPSEVQVTVETETLPVVHGVINKLNKTLGYVNYVDTSWKFSYPKDPAYPQLGYNFIDKSDIEAIIGAIYLTRGCAYLGLAYNLDKPVEWIEEDKDTDGLLTPDEYIPPLPFGTLRTNGANYLSSAKTDIVDGLKLISGAVETLLREKDITAGYYYLTTQTISDIRRYKGYLVDLTKSFSGTTTNITIPETVECWGGMGAVEISLPFLDTVFDPSYNANEIPDCQFSFNKTQKLTIPMKLSGLFEPAISDLRTISATVTVKSALQDDKFIVSFPDSTINGIFPGGIQRDWFNENTADNRFNFYLTNSVGSPISSTVLRNATLTVGGKILSGKSNWDGSVYFATAVDSYGNRILPTASDVITYNTLYGTQVTLNVLGYQPVSFLIDGGNVWKSIKIIASG